MLRRAVLLMVLLVVALPTAGAHAQGSPFNPLPPAPGPPPPPPPSPAPSPANDDGGLSGLQQALIFAAGGVLLIGIGIAIVVDARSKAPTRGKEHPAGGPGSQGREGRDPHRERAKAQARRKQKAARAQRRRNR